jgi:dTMP kinase
MKKGILITMEGIDGSGKSTQVSLLVERLKGLIKDKGIIEIREPGSTKVGEEIRGIVKDKSNKGLVKESELLLYLAARAQLVREVIRPALDNECIVICDRFLDSSIAYQGYGRGINIDILKRMDEFARGYTYPDLTFVIDIPIEEAIKRRGETDRIEESGREFFNKVRTGYLNIAIKESYRVHIINGEGDKREVGERIFSIVKDRLNILL